MADLKISALTSASTPLAGTEVLPIVQSGSTVKVSVANLTAARDVAAKSVTVSGEGAYGQGKLFSTSAEGLLLQAKTGSFFDAGMLNAAGNAYAYTVATGTVNMKLWGDTILGNNSGQSHTVNGNLVMATSGTGVDFSATPGTGTSELLADYEEGTWTPVVASTSGSITSYTASGTYTKVGRLVTATFTYNITDAGTGSGAITVTAPFTAGSGALYPTGSSREVAVAGWGGYTGIDPSGTTITVQKYDGGFAGSTGVVVRGTISYQV
jgi:hypothetical protein